MQRFFGVSPLLFSSNGNRKVQAVGVMKRFACVSFDCFFFFSSFYLFVCCLFFFCLVSSNWLIFLRVISTVLCLFFLCLSLSLVCLCVSFCVLISREIEVCYQKLTLAITSIQNNLRFELEQAACKPYVNVVHRRIVKRFLLWLYCLITAIILRTRTIIKTNSKTQTGLKQTKNQQQRQPCASLR